MTINTSNELVINWHITEACNYRCQYCYAHWQKDQREILHNRHQIIRLLHKLADYFHHNLAALSDDPALQCNSIRLNIAGGEPFLYPQQVTTIVQKARSLGMQVSCITNASKLDPTIISHIAPHLSVLGISVDSAVPRTNIDIGRSEKNEVLATVDLLEMTRLIRASNPDIQLKINTVVNELNWTEDMNTLIEKLAPNKWKVFKVLPVCGQALTIGDREFNSFVRRHQRHRSITTAENNEAMTHSYLMIDPLGRFYQNRPDERGYEYSDSLLEVDIATALRQITFSLKKFIQRY